MPICEKNKQDAQEVMDAIYMIEQELRKGNSDEALEWLKALRDTELIQGVENRACMAVIDPRDKLTDVEKISSGKWQVCKRCDAIVKNLAEHTRSKKCSHGKSAKQFVKTTHKMDNRELQKKSILLVDSIIKKQLTK